MTPERVFAALALVACVLLLLRLAIGARRRARVDLALRRAMGAVRRSASGLHAGMLSLRHRREAAREAEAAIERARKRSGGEWDGNVYRPKSFRKPPRDKMH
ncbi:MAG TPA: hypothetical protein VGM74_12695 [Burkholderiaceae bacterium]|jgi:hypothetical protein